MFRRYLPTMLLVALAGAGSAPAADAATRVSFKTERYTDDSGNRLVDYGLRVTPDAGQRDDLRVRVTGARVTVSDARRPVRAGRGCRAAGRRAVTCAVRLDRGRRVPTFAATIGLGGGDDRLVASFDGAAFRAQSKEEELDQYPVVLRGGPGDDRITVPKGAQVRLLGGDGDDRLTGGAGEQVLVGEGGSDELRGGAGDDAVLADAAPAAGERGTDRLDGGAGRDFLDLAEREQGVTLDLGDPSPSPTLDDDVVRRFEHVDGGEGPDVLTGTAAAEEFHVADEEAPEGSGDVVRAGGGNDELQGDALDRLDAGAGDDELQGGSELAAPVAEVVCGAGSKDRLQAGSDFFSILPPLELGWVVPDDCEHVASFDDTLGTRVRATDGGLRLSACQAVANRPLIRIGLAGRAVASGRVTLRKGCRPATVPFVGDGRARLLAAGPRPVLEVASSLVADEVDTAFATRLAG